MMFFPYPRVPRFERWFVAEAAMTFLLFSVGCASPGPPRPPSLRLPEVVKDLAAERTGDEVNLHWTTPSKTTDNMEIKGTLTAEICRDVVATGSSATPTSCTAVKRLTVVPGPSSTTEALPRPLTLDPVVLLSYRVRILNTNQRSAGPSPEAFAAGGTAPPAVEQLRGKPVREGALLEWRREQGTAAVVLDRLIEGDAAPVATAAQQAGSKPSARSNAKVGSKSGLSPIPSPASAKKPPQPSTPAVPVEVRLQTISDAGGTLDRTALSGVTYRYTAERVRTVTLGGHTLQLHSVLSAPIDVLLRDTFPPLTPTRLAAVPGGTTPESNSIDLSWEPDTDPDLAGYFVYRQEVSPSGQLVGTASRLNTTPLPAPAYSDETAVAGQRYAYRVTAVDAVGNESAPSADVQETRMNQRDQ